jgi:hypothetical protein
MLEDSLFGILLLSTETPQREKRGRSLLEPALKIVGSCDFGAHDVWEGNVLTVHAVDNIGGIYRLEDGELGIERALSRSKVKQRLAEQRNPTFYSRQSMNAMLVLRYSSDNLH